MKINILTNYAWAMIWRGILAMVFGLVALFLPGSTLLILAVIFALFVLGDGVLAFISAMRAVKQHKNWPVFLVEGLFGVTVGVMALAWPNLTVVVLLFLVASWAIATGLIEILAAATIPWRKFSRWLIALAGVFSIIVGIVMFIYPAASLTAIILFIGVYAFLFGIILLFLGLVIKMSRRTWTAQA